MNHAREDKRELYSSAVRVFSLYLNGTRPQNKRILLYGRSTAETTAQASFFGRDTWKVRVRVLDRELCVMLLSCSVEWDSSSIEFGWPLCRIEHSFDTLIRFGYIKMQRRNERKILHHVF